LKTEKIDPTPIPQPRVNLRILPFGKLTLVTEGADERAEEEEISPVYGEPGTTSIDSVDITFSGRIYRAPKTTGASTKPLSLSKDFARLPNYR
jgi:hypothetical protein